MRVRAATITKSESGTTTNSTECARLSFRIRFRKAPRQPRSTRAKTVKPGRFLSGVAFRTVADDTIGA